MKKVLKVDGLDCANCAAKIERGVQALSGVTSATVNFMTSKMTIEADDAAMPTILEEAAKIVSKVEPGAVLKKA